jgi:hypothetical protein
MKPGSAITDFRAKLNQVKPSIVFLVLALVVGGYVRLAFVLASPFPLNDGGLFYQMTQELITNQFRLPVVTEYNHLGIPYAYPPLAFYLTGLLSRLTGWSLLEIFRILPAIVTILTIPAFYLLAKDMIEDDNQLAVAVLIFALTPVTINWAIMGGGVTRSIAFLTALLTLHFLFRLYAEEKPINFLWVALFTSLTILTHPETGFHTAAAVPVFCLFYQRNKKGTMQTLAITLLTIAFTDPWWGEVVVRHGFTPFTSAFLTAGQDGNAFFDLFNVNLTDEAGISSIAFLGLIGFFLFIARKRYFAPVLFLISYFVAPRSAKIFIAPFLVVMASFALTTILNLIDRWWKGKTESNGDLPFANTLITKVFLALLFFQWFTSELRAQKPFTFIKMTQADQSAFDWIKANTDEDSRFVIVTGYLWSSDPVSEWMPALTARTSVGTVQGTEWLGGGRFMDAVVGSRVLQNCLDQSVTCLEDWAEDYQADYDHVYVRKQELDVVEGKAFIPVKNALAELLKDDGNYVLVYETLEVSIFQKK